MRGYDDSDFTANDMCCACGGGVDNGAPSPYHDTYTMYPTSGLGDQRIRMYLIVRDGEARWGWWDKDAQKWMMTWAKLPYSYEGGFIGLTTYADQVVYENIHITDLDERPTSSCATATARASMARASATTATKRSSPSAACAARECRPSSRRRRPPRPRPARSRRLTSAPRDVCLGNDGSSTPLSFSATSLGGEWTPIDDTPLSSACAWTTAQIDGYDGTVVQQGSNAWGNYPGENTLQGCNLIYETAEYTNFILETRVSQYDNGGSARRRGRTAVAPRLAYFLPAPRARARFFPPDGVGFVFGWKAGSTTTTRPR